MDVSPFPLKINAQLAYVTRFNIVIAAFSEEE